jgi:DNA gyrase subunit A
MGRSAAGVMGIRLRNQDEVISTSAFNADQNLDKKYELITVLENGFGKRTLILKNFPLQKRGGYGVIASRNSEKTGKVIEAFITCDMDQDLIIASQNGQVIRIPSKAAKLLGRDTQGVRLMRLSSGDKVASVSAVKPTDEDVIVNANIELPKEINEKEKLDVSYYDGREKTDN